MMNKVNRKKTVEPQNTVRNYTVREDGTILSFIQQLYTGKSRTSIKAMLKHRQISVNGQIVLIDSTPVKVGDTVALNSGLTPNKFEHDLLRIIYEDDAVVVAEKKSGLLSVGTDREKQQTAYALVRAHVKETGAQNKIFVLHRLDRDTSGILMFAKSAEIQEKMQRAWKTYVTDRRYVLVVSGRMPKKEGEITTWLTEEKDNNEMHSSVTANGGQRSTTYYKVLKCNGTYSMLEARLETGRKNQIRVHMQDLGHSVVGDKKYGGITSPIQRLALHAYLLEFIHPVTGEKLHFETKIPRQFQNLFREDKEK